LGVIAVLVSFTSKTTPSKAPNILILFSDDHAQQAISAYGSPHIQTPNIDRIASEGAIFLNAFCTNSICAPSRATLLTGKYSHINGHRDNRTTFDAAQDMFPKHLQKAGYQTAWIGKWHLVSNPNYFDYW
jgi:arylsulfatase A-like enzyme